ncbi:phosphomannose isomerase type II C-terminal cupin domain [Acaryochloris sp. CCMEE 5410]|uniref:phosphomannose isomerase type II C-terminal cupin domain n=1 Tax=Acaryochloris sp. CCMEE 5410 TaxID=310037 RepID=UPI000248396E|nr:phosphomannose isomerase type II C-terminal cupin domain [Acaryochloris sp. CCMEE 5410]KAI9131205.1 phosphomannose isomerase type II C-terminal cupin domain [Acaryochloris sp. CCMEE 5410]
MSNFPMSAHPTPIRKNAHLEQQPWGTLTILDTGPSYKIKRLEVNPGQSLGRQLYQHLNIHWIVVAGLAKVTDNTKKMLLGADQSWYVPRQTCHCLENPGRFPLTLMAVEHCVFLGEGDSLHCPGGYLCSA